MSPLLFSYKDTARKAFCTNREHSIFSALHQNVEPKVDYLKNRCYHEKEVSMMAGEKRIKKFYDEFLDDETVKREGNNVPQYMMQ